MIARQRTKKKKNKSYWPEHCIKISITQNSINGITNTNCIFIKITVTCVIYLCTFTFTKTLIFFKITGYQSINLAINVIFIYCNVTLYSLLICFNYQKKTGDNYEKNTLPLSDCESPFQIQNL